MTRPPGTVSILAAKLKDIVATKAYQEASRWAADEGTNEDLNDDVDWASLREAEDNESGLGLFEGGRGQRVRPNIDELQRCKADVFGHACSTLQTSKGHLGASGGGKAPTVLATTPMVRDSRLTRYFGMLGSPAWIPNVFLQPHLVSP
jgi:hypothetical protein